MPRYQVRPTIVLDSAGRVAEDVRCRSCGYNLRGISPQGRCPECHSEIRRSIRAGMLCDCDRKWVRHIAGGVTWIIEAFLSGLLLWLAWRLVGRGLAISPLLVVSLSLSVIGVGLVGGWMITCPDPDGAAAERRVSARRVARYTMVAWALAQVSVLAARWSMGIPWTKVLVPGTWMTALPVILGTVAYVALCTHTRGLALRLPDHWLAQQTRTVMWGAGSTSAIGMVLIVLLSVVGFGPMGVFVWKYGLAPLTGLYGLWAFALLFRYRRKFRLAAKVT
jgi:hypothetical protein